MALYVAGHLKNDPSVSEIGVTERLRRTCSDVRKQRLHPDYLVAKCTLLSPWKAPALRERRHRSTVTPERRRAIETSNGVAL